MRAAVGVEVDDGALIAAVPPSAVANASKLTLSIGWPSRMSMARPISGCTACMDATALSSFSVAVWRVSATASMVGE